MELALQEFIASTETISDIRNLDPNNPIILNIESPQDGSVFLVAASMREPSYMGVPIYLTWVVLDPSSAYYKQALKLISLESPTVSGLPSALAGFNASWELVTTYASIFSPAQFYVNGIGPKGDKGDTGIGLKGDPGTVAPITVDYDYIVAQVLPLVGTGGPVTAETVPVTALLNFGPSSATEGQQFSFGFSLQGPANAEYAWQAALSAQAFTSGDLDLTLLDASMSPIPGAVFSADPAVNVVTSESPRAFRCTIPAGAVTALPQVVHIRADFAHPSGALQGNHNVTLQAAVVIIRPIVGLGGPALVSSWTSGDSNILSQLTSMANLGGSGANVTGSFTLNSGSPSSGIYMYFLYPASYGNAKFEDAGSPGFYGGWDGAQNDPISLYGPKDVQITHLGTTQMWRVYRTDFDGLGLTTWNATPA